jgi:hypothetical protein
VRILLVGEFSRLHNSLKEGLVALGHEVLIVGNGDGFKNYPVDFSTKAKWSESKVGSFVRKVLFKLTTIDVAKIEFGIRFYKYLPQFKNFDAVQLINEAPIQTLPWMERFLLRRIFQKNKQVFLLVCGVDYTIAHYMIEKKVRYTIMDPYFENPKLSNEYRYIFEFLTKNHKKTHELVYENIQGVIASDIDYLFPMQNHPKFLGLIPNPINTAAIEYIPLSTNGALTIFLGINRSTYHSKGISFFEKALELVDQKYGNRIHIITAENLPYKEYIEKFNTAHIVLDQVFSLDQGYNALEAMAKGKVVFTGAEAEFNKHYQLTERVAINALPNVDLIVKELSYLIEHPEEISAMGKRARAFIEQEHDHVKIAAKYIKIWNAQ